jgi:hypothetical protein
MGLSGALFSTTILALTPAVASTDVPAPDPAIPVADPAPAPVPAPVPAVAAAPKALSTLRVNSVRRTVIEGHNVVVRGGLAPAGAGRAVALQLSTPAGRWQTVDHDRTDRQGRYTLVWHAAHTGTRRVRVHFGGTAALGSAKTTAGRTRIYRRALASWYGPGLYGSHLACGGRLSTGTLGVAHKSLPCGTQVTLHYRGRTVRVPVVDRGPYVGAREFDLTAATKQRLGFGSTGVVLTTR